MFPANISSQSVQTVFATGNHSAEGSQVKSIASMDQNEKVDFARKIADRTITPENQASLCADPEFILQFLNNAEVQSILLVSILKGDVTDSTLMQKLEDKQCVACMDKDAQLKVQGDTLQWINTALNGKSEMAFLLKFFPNANEIKSLILKTISLSSAAFLDVCLGIDKRISEISSEFVAVGEIERRKSMGEEIPSAFLAVDGANKMKALQADLVDASAFKRILRDMIFARLENSSTLTLAKEIVNNTNNGTNNGTTR